jgi:hypothetical protein
MNEILLIIITIAAGVLGFGALIFGALGVYSVAEQKGALGILIYIACWLFLGPLIATVSVIVGLYLLFQLVKGSRTSTT